MTDLYTNDTGATKNSKIEELIKRAQYNPKKTMAEELKDQSIDTCNTYNFKYIHLLLPPIDIYRKLCISYDKTYLFIASLFRVLLFFAISKMYYDLFDLSKKENWDSYQFGFLLFFVYACINIILLLIVVLKMQKYPKKESDE